MEPQVKDGQRRVLELLARGAPIGDTLAVLCGTLEEELPGGLCSVLLLDPKAGTLRHGAGPSLPKVYNEAVDGVAIGPLTGSCGTAAFERREVTVEDIARDPLWASYRDLALPYGLAACASIPIFDARGAVLGTFALYHRAPGPFHPAELALLRDASGLAALVIESDRRAAAFRENETKLAIAVDAAGIGLWSWDLKTDFVAWEPPLCALFGRPAGWAPAGREEFLTLVHPEDRARVGNAIGRGVESGRWEDEYRVLRADGGVRWVMAKGTVLRTGRAEVVLGALLDVTEHRERDEQRRQAQKLEAIGQLTAGIAHNFNNMLMGILPNLAIAIPRASPDIAPLLRDAQRATQRAVDLVRQLTTYAGRNRPAARRVELLEPLVERTVAMCRTMFDRGIAIETRYDHAARALVDAAQLEQALLNLLINARDAIANSRPSAPRVVVEVGVVPAGAPELAPELEGRPDPLPPRDHVLVRVEDNGSGMDSATLSRIYEPFFTTKEAGRGTGLGLAVTHAIVREHGGFMRCQSSPNRGATFSIYLPAEVAASSVERIVPDSVPALGSEMVLIVDDEPSIQRVVALILEGAGYRAKVASSGQAALDILSDPRAASEVALVILDVSMPGIPSRELRSKLRELAPGARVLFFTGYAYEASGQGDAVLEKPVTEGKLLRTIREVLDRA